MMRKSSSLPDLDLGKQRDRALNHKRGSFLSTSSSNASSSPRGDTKPIPIPSSRGKILGEPLDGLGLASQVESPLRYREKLLKVVVVYVIKSISA
jgi:hypothetical protein